jgi:hypothetical protein
MYWSPYGCLPGPPEAAIASSPMKKSRSSVPRFPLRWPPAPAPPVRKDGLFATAGRPEPEPPAPPVGPFVAIAVGKTNEGESLPAKPRLEHQHEAQEYMIASGAYFVVTDLAWRNPCRCELRLAVVVSAGAGISETYLSMTTAGVWLAIMGESAW